jgi:hypothetical protein
MRTTAPSRGRCRDIADVVAGVAVGADPERSDVFGQFSDLAGDLVCLACENGQSWDTHLAVPL